MTTISDNDIARAIYFLSKGKSGVEQVNLSKKVVNFLFRKRLLSKASLILSQLRKIINQEESRVTARISSPEQLKPQIKTHLEQILKNVTL
jgi:F0F1-type ATP synthase delta subunit